MRRTVLSVEATWLDKDLGLSGRANSSTGVRKGCTSARSGESGENDRECVEGGLMFA